MVSSIKSIFDFDKYYSMFREPELPFIEYISRNAMVYVNNKYIKMFTEFIERVDTQFFH
jgi:hypothetical protein